MKLTQLNPAVDLVIRSLPGAPDFPVQAAIVRGQRHRVVIDTLIRPADMALVDSPSLVIYTHSDWDHCWGTAAFPGVPVIGHSLTRERLLTDAAANYLAEMQQKRPEAFEGSAIIAPDITFADRLAIDAGGLTLLLEHLPGHTADEIIIHVPELELLLAGDAVETPIPSLNEVGHIQAWGRSLRRWGKAGLACVVPSHGEPGGVELLQRNADYIEGLLDGAGQLLKQGYSLEEIQQSIPVERFVPEIDRYHPYYRQGHLQNLAHVVQELTGDRPGRTLHEDHHGGTNPESQ